VIAEACHILRRSNLAAAALDILHDVERCEYQLPLRFADRAGAVAKLMKKYADVPMSLADACLVDMATQLDTGRILTLDAHFGIYRWGKRRAFELVIDLK
jgi:predicted nucleic acid-binding protein